MYILAGNQNQRQLIADAMGDYGPHKDCSSAMEVLMLVFRGKDTLPNLIIMPYREVCGMGGLAALKHLRKRGYSNVPVMLTAYESERSECEQAIKDIPFCCCIQWGKLSGGPMLPDFELKPNL